MNDLVVRRIGRLTTWQQPVVTDAALVIRAGRVAWIGPDHDVPRAHQDIPELDAAGAAVLPGFVDCHTHAVWAGDRRQDFAARVSGDTGYAPDGIAATVRATRAATDAELEAGTIERVRAMQRHGTTTVEVKTGYGLTPAHESRLLDIIADIGASQPGNVESTYLAAHVIPPDYDGTRDDYVAEVIDNLPAAALHGARWCDVFCDDGAFTVDEARRILTAARQHGIGLRIHAEQLAHTGAAQLAAALGCASADHLDKVTTDDARALATSDVVAVVVPVVSLYTRSGEWGHARRLADAGCTLAVATDCNPGSAWCESMPYAMQLACLAMGLSVDTVLRAATLGGAHALRRTDVGHLGVGARGDLVVVTSDHETDVCAHLGANPVNRTVVGGKPIA